MRRVRRLTHRLPPVALPLGLLLLAAIGGSLSCGGSSRHDGVAKSTSSRVSNASGATGQTTAAAAGAVTQAHNRDLRRDLGQMIVARLTGTIARPALLARIRAGEVGGVILFSDSFAAGRSRAAAAIAELQRAARAGGVWPLLVMTDQEGGEVRRVPGVGPVRAPHEMASADVARREGVSAGAGLRRVGVNVDLAPVADVEQLRPSFLGSRAFGSSPDAVAKRACAFARGLSEAGVGYTLKHFPGLGTARGSTDAASVTVDTAADTLRANYSPYRACGRGARTLVMVSNAAYPTLAGATTPAVATPEIFARELKDAGVDAVTISDDLQAAGLRSQTRPALRAVDAGLDLLLYAQTERGSAEAYEQLAVALGAGRLDSDQVSRAGAAISRLKTALAR